MQRTKKTTILTTPQARERMTNALICDATAVCARGRRLLNGELTNEDLKETRKNQSLG